MGIWYQNTRTWVFGVKIQEHEHLVSKYEDMSIWYQNTPRDSYGQRTWTRHSFEVLSEIPKKAYILCLTLLYTYIQRGQAGHEQAADSFF